MSHVRYRFAVEYDGSGFAGWQVQPAQQTVQGELIRAFETATRSEAQVVGSGRTDAGVHARGQVAHVDLPQAAEDLPRLERSVGAIAGPDISIRDLAPAEEGFHARFSARERRYRYTIALRPHALARRVEWLLHGRLDADAMDEAASAFIGTYPATSLCAAHAPDRDAVVAVKLARITLEGDRIFFDVAADRFVTHMVRIMVGTLVEVGRGRRDAGSVRDLLTARDRSAAGPTAPPHGLCLEHVEY